MDYFYAVQYTAPGYGGGACTSVQGVYAGPAAGPDEVLRGVTKNLSDKDGLPHGATVLDFHMEPNPLRAGRHPFELTTRCADGGTLTNQGVLDGPERTRLEALHTVTNHLIWHGEIPADAMILDFRIES